MSDSQEFLDPKEQAVADYVLGLLPPAEREAFERRLAEDPELRRLLRLWEERLSRLYAGVEPVEPPSRVWKHIARRLDDEAHPGRLRLWMQSIWLWRGATALALIALVAVLLMPLREPEQGLPQAPVYSLVVRDAQAHPLWIVNLDWRRHHLDVTPVAQVSPGKGKDHELWLVPATKGAAPISLGVLGPGGLSGKLPADIDPDNTKALAVSLEPSGGSPTGAPTGPILYVAPVPGRA